MTYLSEISSMLDIFMPIIGFLKTTWYYELPHPHPHPTYIKKSFPENDYLSDELSLFFI